MNEEATIAEFLAGAPHAVVGASRDRSKIGNLVLRAYLQARGPVSPVVPAYWSSWVIANDDPPRKLWHRQATHVGPTLLRALLRSELRARCDFLVCLSIELLCLFRRVQWPMAGNHGMEIAEIPGPDV